MHTQNKQIVPNKKLYIDDGSFEKLYIDEWAFRYCYDIAGAQMIISLSIKLKKYILKIKEFELKWKRNRFRLS